MPNTVQAMNTKGVLIKKVAKLEAQVKMLQSCIDELTEREARWKEDENSAQRKLSKLETAAKAKQERLKAAAKAERVKAEAAAKVKDDKLKAAKKEL